MPHISGKIRTAAPAVRGIGEWAAASHLAAIVASFEDAIVGEDFDGIVTFWNRAAEGIFGYTAEEMVGSSILKLIPAARQDEEVDILTAIRSGEAVPRLETVRQAKDGRLIEVSLTVAPVLDEAGRAFGASEILRDLSLVKTQEREIARLSRLYAALARINQAIMRRPNRDEFFFEVCRHLVDPGGFRVAWIGLSDPKTRQIVPVAHAGQDSDYVKSIEIDSDERSQGHGPAALAFRSGAPCICNDMFDDPAMSRSRAQFGERTFRASAAFPLQMGDQTCGVLTVYGNDVDCFQDNEVALLQEAAGEVSFALDNFAREEERKRAEDAARSEKIFSDAMIDSMPGILYFYDENGRFLRWNKNFEIVSGYSAAEIERMSPLEFFRGDDKQILSERIAEVFETGASFVEAPFVAKDGTATRYFFTGRRIVFEGRTCLVGMGIDVSDRVRAESERQATEGRYRTLFEYAPDGILIADPNSRYLDANASICRMLGYSRHELVGRHAADIVAPQEMPHIGEALDQINVARADYHREWQFKRKDGSLFPAEVIATLMPDGNLMGMIRDITERKEAERALRDINQTLELKVAERTADLEDAVLHAERADRVKSAFLATMSHELRTPLNSIIGFTGIVLQGLAGPLNPEQTKQLGMVRSSARHLLELINDVLDISKIEAGQLAIHVERFELPDLIERVVAGVKPLADRKALTLTVAGTQGPLEILGDRRRLQQILTNLLNNAIKFTDHGSVTLTVDLTPESDGFPETASRPAVRLSVADTGIGIRPEDLPTLFQPFRQIDSGLARQHEGTGLGLAICRRLAALMGGEISATSEWGKGSTFTVTIPSARDLPTP
jgi:PAS domain S-box-containing protein